MGQSEYKNISKKQLLTALERIATITALNIEKSTKHTWKLETTFATRPYPIPVGHPDIHSWVVDGVVKWLVTSEVCSKEEFNKCLKKKS